MEEDKDGRRQHIEGGVPGPVLNAILRWATWRNVLVLWVVFLGFNLLVVGPAYRALITRYGGVGVIDFLITFRTERAYSMLATYGPSGRRYYTVIALTVDVVFPLLSALVFSLTIARLFRTTFSREGVLHRALFVPFAALLADLLENAGLVTMLLSYPRRLPAVALLTSSFSTVKWTAISAESFLLLIGLVAWLVAALRGKTAEEGVQREESEA